MFKPVLRFVPDPKADVVLTSSDGEAFPVRRVSLQANSEVFDGMFLALPDQNATEADPPVIKLDDKAADLHLFLRYLVRDQVRRSKAVDPLTVDETKTLLHLADKYGAKALIDAVALQSLPAAVAADLPGMFGFAMTHDLIPTAREALALFQKKYCVHKKSGYHPAHSIPYGGEMKGDAPHLVTEVPRSDLGRLPFRILLDLFAAEERVHLHGHLWADEAKTIKLT